MGCDTSLVASFPPSFLHLHAASARAQSLRLGSWGLRPILDPLLSHVRRSPLGVALALARLSRNPSSGKCAMLKLPYLSCRGLVEALGGYDHQALC